MDLKALQKEYDGLRTTHADLKEQLAAVNEELKPMKDIRYWVSKVLSPEQTGEKQPEPKHSLKERLQYEQEQKKQKQVQKAPKQKKQDIDLREFLHGRIQIGELYLAHIRQHCQLVEIVANGLLLPQDFFQSIENDDTFSETAGRHIITLTHVHLRRFSSYRF